MEFERKEKTKMKKMVVGGWCRVLGALCLVLGAGCLVPWAAVAEPSVEITKVKLADNGWTDKSGNLVASDDASNRDAARAHLGAPWRMMTKDEIDALIKNCKVKWMTLNGVNGYLVTGNTTGYEDKYIFLPAAGYGLSGDICGVGSYGHYWSSSPDGSYYAQCIDINSADLYEGQSSRFYGSPVRPVRGSAE